MKQRDIELIYKQKAPDRATQLIIFKLAEEITDLRIALKECAATLVVMERVVTQVTQVHGGMADKIDRITRRLEPDQ